MMMKTRLLPLFSLLAVLLASCATSVVSTEIKPTQVVILPAPVEATPVQPSIVDPASTDPAVVVVEPVATSRGPDLEATDPAKVSLASGSLHFVEFFRFT
jgi:hypothetical protein